GIWIAFFLVAGALASVFLADALTNEMAFTNNPESKRAYNMIEDHITGPEKANEFVIVRSETLTVDDPAFQQTIGQIYKDLQGLGGDVVESVIAYQPGAESLVSADRRTTIMPVVMAGDFDEAMDNIGQVRRIVDSADGENGFTALVTGDASLDEDFGKAAEKDLQTAELVGVPIALLVLVVVFGALVAALIPVIIGALAILMAVGAAAVIGQAHELSIFITNMIVAMGLALGIDYSLFIISRYREERKKGLEKIDAIGIAGATASRAVFFSGMTVVLALFGMLIVPMSLFLSLATGAILVAIAAVAAALTLLPAVLSLLGDRVNALRVPILGWKEANPNGKAKRNFWDWATRRVMRRPVISIVVAAGLLVAMAVPAFDIHLGAAGISTLPDTLRTKEGFLILQEDFSSGLLTPARIAIHGEIDSEPVQQGISRLEATLKADPAFYGEPTLQTNAIADYAELSMPISGDATSDPAIDAVRKLRKEYIPQSFDGVSAEVLVTGSTAIHIDYIDLTGNYMPIVLIFVLGLSFVLLTLVFRSIVLPIKAILLNLLSVGAAYGLVILVFQKGIGAGVLGFQETGEFEAWVPIFLFCMLFGLSMDYHVFLLSRIREHFDQTQDNTESVAFGLTTTGGIITGAALIMVTVFSGFSAGDLVMFQQMGFGLAVAVLFDATIIRSILVPAAMQLLGRANWYLPPALEWLPRIRVDSTKTGQPRTKE
ncbi:MAG: MMPL family transporter, partial [Chloroflexi bacterium]|nr:MMPL family transporter [Chloroflexota bacterium]